MHQKKWLENKTIDVIGIGNAIVDVLVHVEDSFLEKHGYKKGTMTLINDQQAKELYSNIKNGLETSGGSAANSITGISQLGGRAGFIGRTRNDNLGKVFTSDICNTGTIFNTPSVDKGPSTGRCMIFVSPDAERTMCTYLGSSVLLDPEDLDLSLVKESKVLYLEGYLWDNDSAKRAFIKAAEISKKSGGEVALSLSDSFCVNRHKESFKDLINGYIDILFANEEEIISLYDTSNLDEALNILRGKCKISVITMGEKGSYLLEDRDQWKISSYKLGETIDTTGAGDMYAGGFLYAYTKGDDIITCGKIGSLCAAHVVTHLGPRAKIKLNNLIDLII